MKGTFNSGQKYINKSNNNAERNPKYVAKNYSALKFVNSSMGVLNKTKRFFFFSVIFLINIYGYLHELNYSYHLF